MGEFASNDLYRGEIDPVDTTTSSTSNTWTELFPGNLNRNWLFVQNISDTEVEIGVDVGGTVKRYGVLPGGNDDSLNVSGAFGCPTNPIYVRCPTAASKPILAHERV